jgi:hypothetical protein
LPVGADKRPLFPWKEYQTHKPDLDRVNHWAHLEGIAGWAVITGAASGIVILDFDGDSGANTMRKLQLSPHVRTGSGGFHVRFKYPGWRVPTVNSRSKRELGELYPNLDIRADGGYAVFCGRNQSGEYERLRPLDAYESIERLPLGVRRALGLVSPVESPSAAPKPPAPRIDTGASASEDLKQRLISQANAMVSRGEGRNNAGFWLAVQLRDNGIWRDSAESVMRRFHTFCPRTNAKGQPEVYTITEALNSFEAAYSRGPREPWKI